MASLTLDPIDITDIATLETLDVNQLTTKSIAGTGVFDVLMSVVKLHLLEEFNAGRITGAEYSTVYLGALSAVMQQSNAFIANHQTEEEIRARIGLIRQQTVTELAQTDDTILNNLGFNGTTTIEGLVAQQKLLNTQQIAVTTAQALTATAEKDLIGQKIVTELAQTCDNLADAINTSNYGFNDSTAIEGLLALQLLKTSGENDLTEQKLVTEVANTSNQKPIGLGQMDTTTALNGVTEAQKKKIGAEEDLLIQKTKTELAQISDTTGSAVTVAGVIGKQKLLFAAQTAGFARDAEQKAAKLMLDSWAVSATMNNATANNDNHLNNLSVGVMVEKLLTGLSLNYEDGVA